MNRDEWPLAVLMLLIALFVVWLWMSLPFPPGIFGLPFGGALAFTRDRDTDHLIDDMLAGRACWGCGAPAPGSTERHLCLTCYNAHVAAVATTKRLRKRKKRAARDDE